MARGGGGDGAAGAALRLLFALDAARLRSALARPTAGAWVGVGLPLLALAAAVVAAGRAVRPSLATTEDGVTLGVLLSAPVAFAAYGTLFRSADAPLLRRLGIPADSLYAARALRLLGVAIGGALLAVAAFAAGGAAAGRPLAAALAASCAAWGVATVSLSSAARKMAGRRRGETWGLLALGIWDSEVAAAAPLVYAPVPPLFAGAVAGGVAAGGGRPWLTALLSLLAAGALAAWARARYREALPRFAPQALEMSFSPPPEAGSGELRLGTGAARLVPRRVAAVWARDATVAGRRFGWATRVVWPVAVLSVVALARWGEQPGTRAWVAVAALLVYLIQGAAVLGLGRLERAGRRWVDRAAGVSGASRLAGRWLWGWGMSLWLGVPLALAWGWWAGAGPGWVWLLVGAASSALAAAASVASARRWR